MKPAAVSLPNWGGLRKVMPITAVAAGLAALSMSGIPPFLGFVGKELIYEATQEAHLTPTLVIAITAVAVSANILTIVAAGLVAIRPFYGPHVKTPKHAHEAPLSMWLGPIILAGVGLTVGLGAALFGEIIVGPAVSGILAESAHVELHLIPTKFSLTLLLSAITIGGGIGLYFIHGILIRIAAPFNIITKWGPEQWYDWSLKGMMTIARYQTRILQSGYLRYYLAIVILTTVGTAGYTLFTRSQLSTYTIWRQPDFTIFELLIYLTILAATLVVVQTRSRLAAVAALGVVGFGVALIFILFGAPDLAMTQFSIETLSVILLVLVLYRLPRFTVFSNARQHARDIVIALAGGGLMTLLVLVVTGLPSQSRLTPYFAESSLSLAKGHNVVNVILVDFRGFDTMGEITVLGIAALGVYGLMKLRLEKADEAKPGRRKKRRLPESTEEYLTIIQPEKSVSSSLKGETR